MQVVPHSLYIPVQPPMLPTLDHPPAPRPSHQQLQRNPDQMVVLRGTQALPRQSLLPALSCLAASPPSLPQSRLQRTPFLPINGFRMPAQLLFQTATSHGRPSLALHLEAADKLPLHLQMLATRQELIITWAYQRGAMLKQMDLCHPQFSRMAQMCQMRQLGHRLCLAAAGRQSLRSTLYQAELRHINQKMPSVLLQLEGSQQQQRQQQQLLQVRLTLQPKVQSCQFQQQLHSPSSMPRCPLLQGWDRLVGSLQCQGCHASRLESQRG